MMATRPGEENVATLFGDIHYFYGPDTVKPRHHRFDKGSYVYLFENANERRCRIEIANHPGSPEQDAFDGFLDQTHVRYSYKQACMVSLQAPDAAPQNEWHLPTYDPRNENKYHYKLESLDIYFWTHQDALQFVNGVRRVLPPNLVEVLDEPAPPAIQQPSAMRGVVQKLENVAIQDERTGSGGGGGVASAQGQSLPGPPPGQPPSRPSPHQAQQQQQPPATFVPMAYNPAAPAAPEQVRHREKTPPPDEDPLNPLAVAVAYDYQGQPFTPAFPPQGQFIPGVTSPGMPPQGFGQHPGMQRAATMPVHGGLGSPGLRNPYGSGTPGLPPPPPTGPPPPSQLQQSHSQPAVPQQGPSGAAQPAQQPTPPQVTSPGLPPGGGYSSYSYSVQQPQQQQAQQANAGYGIHQQGYQPTESEASAGNPYFGQAGAGKPSGRLEENVGRLEKGVTGMFKKFEKKFG